MLQIRHKVTPYIRGTFAIELPSKETLLDVCELGVNNLKLLLGMSIVHPNDVYDKKLGRQIVGKRLTPTNFILSHIEIREKNRVVFVYETLLKHPYTKEDTLLLQVGFSYIPKSNNVRLEYLSLPDVEKSSLLVNI